MDPDRRDGFGGKGPPPHQPHQPPSGLGPTAPVNAYFYPVQAPFAVAQMPPQMGMGMGMGVPGMPQPQVFAAPVGTYGVQPMPMPHAALWMPFVPDASASLTGSGSGSGLDPERARKVLADALRRGKELGMSQREVLERLQKSNKPEYRGIDWTTYFLENAVFPGGTAGGDGSRAIASSASTSRASRSTTLSADEMAQKKRKTTKDSDAPPKPPGRPCGRPPKRKVLTTQQNDNTLGRSCSRSDGRSLAPSISTASSSTKKSRCQSRRGRTLLEFHTDTYIPPSDDTHKPVVPRRDGDDDLHRFTGEEKIFLIHYMRWRLREGKVPSKDTLFKELAEELPHHDAQAWKKHWGDNCQLPDEIYIAALKRAENQSKGLLADSESDSDLSTLTLAPSSDDEYRPSSEAHCTSSPPQAVASASNTIPCPVNRKVTDDDIRAMALYMVEKRHVWSQYKNHFQSWEEFARRKENVRRRSHSGWNSAARTHAAQIRKYYEEYLAAMSEDERDEGETRELVYPPDPEDASVSAVPQRTAEQAAVPKNPGNGVTASGSSQKYPKVPLTSFDSVKVKREYIEISDSD